MASNRIGDNIIIRYQDLEELDALVKRQRIALDELLKAVNKYLNALSSVHEIDRLRDLHEIYKQVSSSDAMTGASEK